MDREQVKTSAKRTRVFAAGLMLTVLTQSPFSSDPDRQVNRSAQIGSRAPWPFGVCTKSGELYVFFGRHLD
jgi:hypothetical protein